MVIGRDLINELGITFNFGEHQMEWDYATTPMIDPSQFSEELIENLKKEMFYIHDPETTEAERIQAILDTKYCPADLAKITKECDKPNKEEQQKLLTLLQNLNICLMEQ